MAAPRDLNTGKGYTIGVYLPKEAPQDIVEKVLDRISELVYGELLEGRDNWDPFVVGLAGDVLQIEHGCEC